MTGTRGSLGLSHLAAGLIAASATALLLRRSASRLPAPRGPACWKTGAAVQQPMTPLRGFDIHLVGFHPMRDDPQHQMEAHHYSRQVNEDLMQLRPVRRKRR